MKPFRSVFQVCLAVSLWSLWTLVPGKAHAQSQILIFVPNDLQRVEGNAGMPEPFVVPTRFQQVYAASQFSVLSEGGGWVQTIFFRPSSGCRGAFSSYIPSLQINLSTTPKAPDGLSQVFAENVGSDDTVVFPPQWIRLERVCPTGPNPQPFGVAIPLTTPFYYNPNAGNLLLDIRNISGATNFDFGGSLDTQFTVGDSISIAITTDVHAALGARNSVGLVTLFRVQPVPRLNLSLMETNLLFRWVNQGDAWTLEQTSVIGPTANWQPAGGEVSINGLYKEVRLPLDTNVTQRFFRLVLPTTSQ